jgi:protein-S-isoprenylcysteine O-methyltransferase Ste14
MPGDSRREAERPPWFAVIGTIIVAPLFAGSVIVLGPYVLSGWKLDAPFFGWAPSRWVGVALVVLPVPPLLDFLVRFVREGHGTPAPFAPPRHLVVSGPFRCVRNPAYLCAVWIIVGQGLIFGSTSVLVYAGIVALAFHLFVVLYEEPTLRAMFGAEYVAYCREVPRWIPRLTPAARGGNRSTPRRPGDPVRRSRA